MPQHIVGDVSGAIMAAEGTNTDEDFYSVGRLGAGNTVSLTTVLPGISTLSSRVRLVNSAGAAVNDADGNPDNGAFTGTIAAADEYYAVAEAASGAGELAQYLLRVDIGDSVPPTVPGIDGLPAEGTTSSSVISSMTVTFSERMDPGTVLATGAFGLSEAGPDGIFDTPSTPSTDDVVVSVTPGSTFSEFSRSITLLLQGGPLSSGLYRFIVNNSVLDRGGNQIDGNADGSGGDPFQRTFTLSLPAAFVLESQNNNTIATATSLPLTENPFASGFHLGFGLGSIDPSSDLDFWSFTAQAGDRVGVAVDTPNSGIAVGPRLYNSSGSEVTSGFGAGPDNDGYISHYVIPSSGTYYVRLERWTDASVGTYELRVELARGIDLESDQSYHNDTVANADLVTLVQSGNQRSGAVAGTIMGREGTNLDEDYFRLGLLNAGNLIDLSLNLPSSSSLVSRLRVFHAGGTELLDEDGNPVNGFRASVLTDGNYYALVDNAYWVRDGRAYSLLASQTWAAAEAAAVSLGGHLVTINDAAEQAFLRNTFSNWDPWIGIHDADGTNTFVWVDGTPVSYTNWYPGEPNTASYDGAYLGSSDGLWRDYPKGNSLNGIAEWADPLGRALAGPGPLAQYILDITISDPIPPQVTGVSRLPDGGTTSELISTFNVTVSEDLKASTVNTPVYNWATQNGKTYLTTPSSMTWQNAESYAQSLGGHLVTIDDAAEQTFLFSRFGGSQPLWIGLNDAATENTFVWVDGTTVSYTNWGSGYPATTTNPDYYDYALLDTDGKWYNYDHHSTARGGSLRFQVMWTAMRTEHRMWWIPIRWIR